MNRNRNNRPFPNLESDRQDVSQVAEWPLVKLDNKTNEYGEFLQRTDAMPRAILLGNQILDLLLFEQAYRDDIYPETPKSKAASTAILDMFRKPNG